MTIWVHIGSFMRSKSHCLLEDTKTLLGVGDQSGNRDSSMALVLGVN
jgi:hypothetical protein